jgi:hypothetical protein
MSLDPSVLRICDCHRTRKVICLCRPITYLPLPTNGYVEVPDAPNFARFVVDAAIDLELTVFASMHVNLVGFLRQSRPRSSEHKLSIRIEKKGN